MDLDGLANALSGSFGARTITIIVCMAKRSGHGVDTSESAFTCTVSALSGATGRGTGDGCAHTGTCGSVTITTRLADGSGPSG